MQKREKKGNHITGRCWTNFSQAGIFFFNLIFDSQCYWKVGDKLCHWERNLVLCIWHHLLRMKILSCLCTVLEASNLTEVTILILKPRTNLSPVIKPIETVCIAVPKEGEYKVKFHRATSHRACDYIEWRSTTAQEKMSKFITLLCMSTTDWSVSIISQQWQKILRHTFCSPPHD